MICRSRKLAEWGRSREPQRPVAYDVPDPEARCQGSGVSLHGREDLGSHLRPGRQVQLPGLGPEQEATGGRVQGGSGKGHGFPEFTLEVWLPQTQTEQEVVFPPLTSQLDPPPDPPTSPPQCFSNSSATFGSSDPEVNPK